MTPRYLNALRLLVLITFVTGLVYRLTTFN